MKRGQVVIYLVAAAGLSVLAACNFQKCSDNTVCVADVAGPSDVGNTKPTPTATPTPAVVDSSCTATCKIHSLRIDEGVSVIPLNASQDFNLTPYTEVFVCDASGKPTSKSEIVPTEEKCDIPRADSVEWKLSSNAITKSGSGFKITVKRVALGEVELSATLEGKTVKRILN